MSVTTSHTPLLQADDEPDAATPEDAAAPGDTEPDDEAPEDAPRALGTVLVADDNEDDEEIKVVRDYSREKVLAEGAKRARGRLVVSPITGELVPVESMQQHMRTHLIDPRWV